MPKQVLVFSADLNKWNTDRKKANISFNLFGEGETFSIETDIDLHSKDGLTEKSLEIIENETKEKLALKEKDKVEIRDRDVIENGFNQFYEKMFKDLFYSKNGKSKKPAVSRYNLFYLKDSEISKLNDDEKYMAYMDIINRKAVKNQFSQIGSYLNEAIQLKKDNPQLLLYMAKYLNEVKKHDEAIEYFEKYLALEPENIDCLLTLAKLYDKKQDFDKADSTYQNILKLEPENLNALVRIAQLKYYKKDDFIPDLEKVNEINGDWLKDFLKNHWDYHLPNAKQDLNPIKAARYLGLENSREIISLAFRKEVPSYYSEKDARVMFNKDEIDLWHKIAEKFYINEFQIELYAENIS